MKNFKKLFLSLNKESVRYMVAGGIAVNLYGIERATADIDIAVDLDRRNLSKFISVAKKLGLKSKVPVTLDDFTNPEKRKGWITDKGMMVFSLYDTKNPFFLIDIFVEIPFDFKEVYKQRKKMKFEDIVIPIIPIKTLIEMKEKSGRPQDRADVFYLKKLLKG
ncbi:MAG: hypothetical protein FJZ16_09995 [Candidatus Omnitrophica bacterium]|nr:hypothetical protein [Candidatus Omnitrophota bacterium]